MCNEKKWDKEKAKDKNETQCNCFINVKENMFFLSTTKRTNCILIFFEWKLSFHSSLTSFFIMKKKSRAFGCKVC